MCICRHHYDAIREYVKNEFDEHPLEHSPPAKRPRALAAAKTRSQSTDLCRCAPCRNLRESFPHLSYADAHKVMLAITGDKGKSVEVGRCLGLDPKRIQRRTARRTLWIHTG